MEFRILGPVEVRHAGRPLALGGPRQRAVLAALVARANEPASVPYLTDSIWDTPPVAPESNLRTYIAGLRRCFADAGADPACLRTQANTYVLDVDPDDVDAQRFTHWSTRGDRALEQGDRQTAADSFATALALWRGEPFEGLTVGPLLRADMARWQDRWLTVHERHANTMLELGAHEDVLADLRRLVTEHPLRERLWVLLLLAQYRAGRPAEALASYQEARRVLANELGVDPGTELRDLHERILRGTVAPAGGPQGFTRVTPRQLPTVPRLFTGRARELARVTEIAASGPPAGIAVIGGFGGTGKTSLALYWAHQNLDRFPDGQLYVNLRGFDPTAAPIPALAALQGFLAALGVPPSAIPAELGGCAALYRSLIADKRMLVVLDNARDAEHVRPLLPGGATCLALVTSRHQLTGLIAAHGAQLVALDVFDTPEAREFLALTLGKERITAEPDAATELLRHCAGLPLALAIIAARAAVNPGFPPTNSATPPSASTPSTAANCPPTCPPPSPGPNTPCPKPPSPRSPNSASPPAPTPASTPPPTSSASRPAAPESCCANSKPHTCCNSTSPTATACTTSSGCTPPTSPTAYPTKNHYAASSTSTCTPRRPATASSTPTARPSNSTRPPPAAAPRNLPAKPPP